MDAPLPRSSAVIAAEGAPLPRGKTRTAVPSASNVDRKNRNNDKDDVLFGTREKKSKKRNSLSDKSMAKKSKVDEAKSEKENAERKTPSIMTFSRLSVGMRLLGRIKSVNENKVVVGLVNGLVASFPKSEASDEHFAAFEAGKEAPTSMESLFPVDSLVRCVVTHVGTGEGNDRTLRISCRASLLNKAGALDQSFAQVGSVVIGSIKSVEDHGVIVNIGLKNVSGFLPFLNAPGGKKALSSIGLQVECEVLARPSKAVVNLKLSEATTIAEGETTTLLSLQPGMLLEAKSVRNNLFDGGVLFSFWSGLVSATCDWIHRAGKELEEKVKTNARVIWVDPNTKTVGVSVMESLVARTPLEWTRNIGDVIEEAVVDSNQPRFGVLLHLPEPAFAHLGRLVDSKDAPDASLVKKEFPSGKKVPCRIVDLNPLDGTYAVSLQPSVIKAAVTTYDSLHPGDKVTGKVVKVDPAFGILLELGHNVRGIVTMVHLSDSAGQETAPESRFKVGQVCKGRVLTREGERVSITLKKSLVTSSLPLIASYADATPGTVAQGFVTKVDDFGVIVSFFGGVHGIVPAFTLGPSLAEDPSQLYRVGQLVKVKVVSTNPEQQRMRLTFNTAADVKMSDEGSTQDSTVEIGDAIATGTIQAKSEDALVVEFKMKKDSKELLKGLLPKLHLSDFGFSSEALFSSMTVGGKIKNAVVIKKRPGKNDYMLTMKLQLVSACKSPIQLEDVDIESTYTGFVSNLTEFGVFVQFGKGLTAFVPLANVWDGFCQNPSEFFVINQTVKICITAVDMETKRIVGALKPSVAGSASASFLQSLLEERRRAFKGPKSLLEIKPGMAVKGRVTHRVEGAGIGVSLLVSSTSADSNSSNNEAQQALGFCTIEHCPEQKLPKVGTEMNFRVLDVDLSQNGVADLSARKSLEQSHWRNEKSSFISMEFDAEVELAKKEYCIISYKPKQQSDMRELCYCSMSDFNNVRHPQQGLKPGSRCRVRVPAAGIHDTVELVSASPVADASGRVIRPRARSGSLSEFMGPRVDIELGTVINAKIRDIRGCWMRFDVRQTGSKSRKVMMHSSDVFDHPKEYKLLEDVPSAFSGHSVGDVVRVRVVEIKGKNVYVSTKPSVIDSANLPNDIDWETNPPVVGKTYPACVDQVVSDGLFLGLSRKVRGFAFCTEVTNNLELLEELFNGQRAESVFPVGRPVKVQVLDVDPENNKLGLKLLWDSAE